MLQKTLETLTTEKEAKVLLFEFVGFLGFFCGVFFLIVLLSFRASFYPRFAVCYFLPALIALVHITELIRSSGQH